MQTLDLDEEKTGNPPKKFWRRQFQQEPTKAQRKFDWIFGVIMPVICFFFDPIFFSSPSTSGAILGVAKPFAYLLSFGAIIAMMAWLTWGERLRWLSAPLAGMFLVSGTVALILGIGMLPLSLFALVIVIGVLGFTPLFTGIVFLRNCVRAIRAAKPFLAKSTLTYTVLLSALTAGVVPYVVNAEIYQSLKRIETGDSQMIRSEGRKLRFVRPLVDTGSLHWRYYNERGHVTQTDETKAVFEVYRDLTGRDFGSDGFSVNAIFWKWL